MVNKIKVLLADDHELFRRSLAEFLNVRESIEVVAQASNGNDAVDQVSQYEPDLVLLDLNMPGRNGFEASKAIKHRRPQTKVYIVSANEGDLYRAVALLNRADGFIPKSTLKRDIVALLDGLLSARMATSHAA